jgi:hypothetical protein
MARNVPVLAWDQGCWLDPVQRAFSSTPVPATSVPYYSERCGERFADAAAFPAALDRFLDSRATYEPRDYVARHLSVERSAEHYLDICTSAYRPGAEPAPLRFKGEVVREGRRD